jgi:hypothetical protein
MFRLKKQGWMWNGRLLTRIPSNLTSGGTFYSQKETRKVIEERLRLKGKR